MSETLDTGTPPETTAIPTGLVTLAGRTRDEVRTRRPWQRPVEPTEACPFETRPQEVLASFDEDWKVLSNPFTPLDWHELIIPAECWEDARLRSLGGPACIRAALRAASTRVDERDHRIGVHVGRAAGMNLTHLHYHLVRLPGADAEAVVNWSEALPSEQVIADVAHFRLYAAGTQTGQVLAVPEQPLPLAETASLEATVRVVSALVERVASSYADEQALRPDFALSVALVEGQVRYLAYVPVLNFPGFTEYTALLEATPLVLAWSHRATAAHLRGALAESGR